MDHGVSYQSVFSKSGLQIRNEKGTKVKKHNRGLSVAKNHSTVKIIPNKIYY